ILCGRGGYGMSRIIDSLDFQKFKKSPKWIIGFSDITVLQAHIFQHYQIATLHAPMAAAFNEDGYKNEYIASLKEALCGTIASYECATHSLNKKGSATADLIGGNLSMIAHLIGSHSSYKTRHKILFLEDVGEYLYNIDRMMIQLERAELFKHLKGLIIGGFSDMKDTTIPFGTDVYNLINHHVKDYKFPICYGFPVSHETENVALKIGVNHELKVTKDGVSLKEIW
ncbi:MAG: LD-carboxypeptidase, partial [Pedobacter sp.]|nr:LD-carboxypeptidase [Chitinophagaceae bacterium]